MLKGKKVFAIFGFCDIRNFNDTTDILKNGVMQYVNDIAKIVHNIADLHYGAANKNIGEAFLLVWKIPDRDVILDEEDNLKIKKGWKTTILTELAVISLVKMISKISKSRRLSLYRENKALSDRMGGEFRVTLGFGLHMGWAIEGAIGSKFKIDASYLSPNVNMAARLQAATKQFGVSILLR